MIVAVRVAFCIVIARHDKDPALHADDVDIGSIKARQYRPCDYFVDSTQFRLAAPGDRHLNDISYH
jgi:hypothetical protein